MIQTDGWTYWNGSKDNTPPALPEERAVTLKFKDGSTACTAVPNSYRWDHRANYGDIIAYRIEPPAGDNLIDTTFGEIGACDILASSVIGGLPPNAVVCSGEPPSIAASAAAGESCSVEPVNHHISGIGLFTRSEFIPGVAGVRFIKDTVVGDINSDTRGSGARYNTGKPQLELLPLRLMARFYEMLGAESIERKRALNALFRLATFQERGDPRSLMLAMCDLGPGVLHDTARVFEYGRKKYAAWNWAKGMAWSVPLACAARHLEAILLGEALDLESGLPHRGHAGCNIVMLETYSHENTYPEGDDRPKAGLLRSVEA